MQVLPVDYTTVYYALGQDHEDRLALGCAIQIGYFTDSVRVLIQYEMPKVIGVHDNRGSARNGWYPGSQFVNYNTPTRAQFSLNLPPFVLR